MRHRVLVLLALLALAFVPSAEAAAPYAPIPTCSPGPAACPSWHTANVSISWQVEPGYTQINCDSRPVTQDTATEQRSCSVSYGPDDVYARTITIRRDATPPQVTGATPSRQPDSGAWYRQPLTVTFGTDVMSGVAACTSPSYGGGDGAAITVSGTCTDVAGNTSAPAGFALKYDATPPAVTPAVDRPPDAKGWYRKPVTVSFAGSDATSGVAACTAATRYAGPDLPSASVAGSCRDAAGNVAEARHSFQYDATAPKLEVVKAEVGKGMARIGWARAGDVVSVELTPRHQRRPQHDRLQGKRRELRRSHGQGRHPLSLRDRCRRCRRQRHDEGRHGSGQAHGPLQPCCGRGRSCAAAALAARGRCEVLQRPALPKGRQDSQHLAAGRKAQAWRTWRFGGKVPPSPGYVRGTSGAHGGRGHVRVTGRPLARAPSSSSAERPTRRRGPGGRARRRRDGPRSSPRGRRSRRGPASCRSGGGRWRAAAARLPRATRRARRSPIARPLHPRARP